MCLEGKFLDMELLDLKGCTFAILLEIAEFPSSVCSNSRFPQLWERACFLTLQHNLSSKFLTFSNWIIKKMASQLCLIIMRSTGHISYTSEKMWTPLLGKPLLLYLQVCWTLSFWFIATLYIFGLGWWYDLQKFFMDFKTWFMAVLHCVC